MAKLSRRSFLRTLAVSALAVLPHARVLGANNDVRAAIIGLGNKGGGHVDSFRGLPGVRVTALCDVDPKRLAKKLDRFDNKRDVFATTDLRRIMDRSDVDVVVIATCNHWQKVLIENPMACLT